MKLKYLILTGIIFIIIAGGIFFLTGNKENMNKLNSQTLSLEKSNAQYLLEYGENNYTFEIPQSITQGNNEIINNSKAFIKITKETSSGDYVYVDLISKVYTGDITVAMGVSSEDDKLNPQRLELWNPHNVTESFTCPVESEVWYNSTHFTCEIYDEDFGGYYNYTHYYDWGNVQNRSAYWNELENWSRVNAGNTGKIINEKIAGKEVWYYQTNIPVVAGVTYKARFKPKGYVDLGEKPKTIKYNYAFFPSSYNQNLKQAVIDENFYFIDPTYNLTDGLVSYWGFDSNANDDHGSNDGSVTGATWGSSNGKLEGGYYLDGSGDFISFGNDASLSADDMSYSLWVKSNSATNPANLQGLLFKAVDTGVDREMGLNFQSTGYIKIQLGDGVGLSFEVETSTDYYDAQWHHVVLTKERGATTDTIKLYVDNSLIGTDTSVNTHVIQNSADLEFGRVSSYSLPERYFKGYLDEVGIWNKALNSTEVSDLWNNSYGLSFENFIPSGGDTCTYTSGNWEIDLADYCVISVDSNVGTGNITFTGTGNVTFNATITACNVGTLPASQNGFMGNNAQVIVGGCS